MLCKVCQNDINKEYLYCPYCGNKSKSQKSSFNFFIIIALLLFSVFIINFYAPVSVKILGKKPLLSYQEYMAREGLLIGDQLPEEIKKLKKGIQDNNPISLKAYIAALERVLTTSAQEKRQYIAFELLNSLIKLSKLNPSDKSILVKIADLAFQYQVFDEAVKYYQQALQISPNDINLQGKLAITYTLLGDYKRALSILEKALKVNPKSYKLNSYMAITYAEMKDTKQAEFYGNKALSFAKNNEQRKVIEKFLVKLKKNSIKQSPASALSSWLKNNSIAGKKFIEVKDNGTVLRAYFFDFPMSNMPQFAKTKFLNNIKEVLLNSGFKGEVVLLDKKDGTVLSKLSLSPQ